MRILVIENEADARALICRILSDVGASVIEAPDAAKAEARVSEQPVDFLISDIGMPERDGYQLIRGLRGRGYDARRLPAIALTAFAQTGDRERAIAAGFQDHLAKPIEGQALVARVSKVLRTSRE